MIAGGLLLGSGWYGGNVAWFEFLLYFGGIALILLDILSSFPVLAWRRVFYPLRQAYTSPLAGI